MLEKVFQQIDVQVKCGNGSYKSLKTIMQDISNKWVYLNDETKDHIAKAIMGISENLNI